MPVTTATHPRRLVPGVYDFYGVQESQYQSMYQQFMEIKDSGKKFEDLVGLAGTGLMVVKGEGSGMSDDNLAQGYTQRMIHAAYGKIVSMTWESIEDDQYDPSIASMLGGHFSKSVQDLKERLAHNVLANGFSTVSGPSANMYANPDTKALFATDHPLVKGGTYSNVLGTGVSLSISSIEQMVINLRKAVNDANIRINLQPDKIIVPVDLEFTAKKILNSVTEAFTADHTSNEVGRLGLTPVITPYLSSSATAYFITASGVTDGLIMFNRAGVMLDADNDFRTKNALFSILCRLSVGYGNPRCVWGAPGS